MSRRALALTLLVCLLAAACGTRRDEGDFLQAHGSGSVPGQGRALQDDGSAGAGAGPAAGPGTAPDVGVDRSRGASAPSGAGDAALSSAADPGDGDTVPQEGTAATPVPGDGTGSREGSSAGADLPADAPAAAGRAGSGTASDVGVTPTTIRVGNVISIKGLAGPDQFPPYYRGAAAFFNDLNARGGINGRKVVFETCDDEFTNSGNTRCVRDFVDDKKVFAFVSNGCGTCDGFVYAADKGVPSVGGLTTDFRSYALKRYWSAFPNPYPQNGRVGWKGKVYNSTSTYRFFRTKYGVKKAGIVYYDNAAPSKNAALATAAVMKVEGIQPFLYGLNVALPQYDSAVLDMKSRGITAVWDAIDITGNQNLCKSIDSNGLELTAKVSTSAGWVQKVGKTFSAPCRNAIFSATVPATVPYHETSHPEIARFRAAFARYFPDKQEDLHIWSVDGWAGAMRFTDAARACGAQLTRDCLSRELDEAGEYTANGLWYGRSNRKVDFDRVKTRTECISVVQWSDAAGTWVTRGDPKDSCYTTPLVGVPLT